MKILSMGNTIHLAILKRQARTMDQKMAIASYNQYKHEGYDLIREGDYILVYTKSIPQLLIDAILVEKIQNLL